MPSVENEIERLREEVRSLRFRLECANQLCDRYKSRLTTLERPAVEVTEAMKAAGAKVINEECGDCWTGDGEFMFVAERAYLAMHKQQVVTPDVVAGYQPSPLPWTFRKYGYEKIAILDANGAEVGFLHRDRDARFLAALPPIQK